MILQHFVLAYVSSSLFSYIFPWKTLGPSDMLYYPWISTLFTSCISPKTFLGLYRMRIHISYQLCITNCTKHYCYHQALDLLVGDSKFLCISINPRNLIISTLYSVHYVKKTSSYSFFNAMSGNVRLVYVKSFISRHEVNKHGLIMPCKYSDSCSVKWHIFAGHTRISPHGHSNIHHWSQLPSNLKWRRIISRRTFLGRYLWQYLHIHSALFTLSCETKKMCFIRGTITVQIHRWNAYIIFVCWILESLSWWRHISKNFH